MDGAASCENAVKRTMIADFYTVKVAAFLLPTGLEDDSLGACNEFVLYRVLCNENDIIFHIQ